MVGHVLSGGSASGGQLLVEDGEALGERLDVGNDLVVDVIGHIFKVVVASYINGEAEGCNVLLLGLD